MALKPSFVVLTGATASQTGGSNVTFTYIGENKDGAMIFADLTATDFRLRMSLELKVRNFAPDAGKPNGFTQQRQSYVLKIPKLLTNGSVTINTVKGEIAYDPETSAAERVTLIGLGQSIIIDSDLTEFVKNGNPA